MATMDPQFTHSKLLEAATLLRLPVGVLVESLGLAPDIFTPSAPVPPLTRSGDGVADDATLWRPRSRQLMLPGLDSDRITSPDDSLLGSDLFATAPAIELGHLATGLDSLQVPWLVAADDGADLIAATWMQPAPHVPEQGFLTVSSISDSISSVNSVSPTIANLPTETRPVLRKRVILTPASSTSVTTTTDSSSGVVVTPDSATRTLFQDADSHPKRKREHSHEDAGLFDVNQAEIEVTAANAPSLGPCSKVWTLLPRIRRKKKPKANDVPSKRKRDPREVARDGPKRRGAYTDETKKRDTALTRILKSCIRCRMNRSRCNPDPGDPYGPCLTCKSITGPTLCKMPCYRYIVTDASLYREQREPWQLYSRRWKSMDLVDIPASDWASSEIRRIVVSPNHLDAPFEFSVREFIPVEGDMLEEQWMTATGKQRVAIPRYALADMNQTAKDMKHYVERNVWKFIGVTVGGLDQLLFETYTRAFRYIGETNTAEEHDLLSNTFRLWVTCRLISNPVHICGEDKLGGHAIYSPDSLHNGKVPMPMVMTAQFECINYTTFLRPLSKAVLKQLNELVLAKKREYWLTIYFSMFILLHSCAMMTKRDAETAAQYDMGTYYANPESIRAHHSGAQTILAHFHFINKGVIPFSLPHTEAGKQELAKAANLSNEQVDFVWRTSNMVNDPERAAHMRYARERGMVGEDLYWVSMLYDREWKPTGND